MSVYQLEEMPLLATETTVEPKPILGPITAVERIKVVDILRGFAIFGILLVNICGFMGPEYAFFNTPWTSTVDIGTNVLIKFFAEGKFITLFSFLFGLGFSIQMARAEEKGVRFVPFFLRRLGVLMLIGIVHCLFFWEGDILHNYAEIGLFLLLFRRRKQKTVLVWAVVLISTLLLLCGTLLVLNAGDRSDPKQLVAQAEKDRAEESKERAEEMRVYGQGTITDMVKRRVKFFLPNLTDVLDAHLLMMFLLGLYVGRSRILENVDQHELFIRRVRRWVLPIGIIASIGFTYLLFADPINSDLTELASVMLYLIGGAALCLVYATTIVLLYRDERWQRRLQPLAAVGQMALSNYLFQSVVCGLIFYHYGLGLFGRVRPFYSLLLAIFIFAIQISLSAWWLSRFKQGPVEWFWRTLTYGKRQPL